MTSPDSKIQRCAKDFGGWGLYVAQTMGNVGAFFGVTRFKPPSTLQRTTPKDDSPPECYAVNSAMSRVENIENQLQQLTPEELKAFRDWFVEFDAEAWDRQFESDVRSGKLDELAEQALRDYEAGRAAKLEC
jgi:hypothetical protein